MSSHYENPAPSARRKSTLLKRNELSRLTADRAKEVEDRLLKRANAVSIIHKFWRVHAESFITTRRKLAKEIEDQINPTPSKNKGAGDILLSYILKWRIARAWNSKAISSVVTTWKDTYGILLDSLVLTNKRDISVEPTSKSPKKLKSKKVVKPIFECVDAFTNFLIQINTNSGSYGSPTGNINSEEAMVLLKETYKFEYSLALQYIQSKYAFHQQLFARAVWRPFHSSSGSGDLKNRYSGYWDFGDVVKQFPPLPAGGARPTKAGVAGSAGPDASSSAGPDASSAPAIAIAAASLSASGDLVSAMTGSVPTSPIVMPTIGALTPEAICAASALPLPPGGSGSTTETPPGGAVAATGDGSAGSGDRKKKLALLRQHIQQMKPPNSAPGTHATGDSLSEDAPQSTEKTHPALKFSNSLRTSLQASSAVTVNSTAAVVASAASEIRESVRHAAADMFQSPSRQPKRDRRSLQRSRSVERQASVTPDRGGSDVRPPGIASIDNSTRKAAMTPGNGDSKSKPPRGEPSPLSLSASLSNNRILRRSKSCLRDSFGSRASFSSPFSPGSAQSTRSDASTGGDGTWHTVPSVSNSPVGSPMSSAKRFLSPSALRRATAPAAVSSSTSGIATTGEERVQVARVLADEYEPTGARLSDNANSSATGTGTQKRQLQMNTLVQSLDQLTNELIMNNNSIQQSQMLRKRRGSVGDGISKASDTPADVEQLQTGTVEQAIPIAEGGTNKENLPKAKVKSQPTIKEFFSPCRRPSGTPRAMSPSPAPLTKSPQPMNSSSIANAPDSADAHRSRLSKSPVRESNQAVTPRASVLNANAESSRSPVRRSPLPKRAVSPSAGPTKDATSARPSNRSPSLAIGRKKVSPANTLGAGQVTPPSAAQQQAQQQQAQAHAQRSAENRALRNRLLSIYNNSKPATPPQRVQSAVTPSSGTVTNSLPNKSSATTSGGSSASITPDNANAGTEPTPMSLDQQQAKVKAEAKAQRSAENKALRNKLQFKGKSKINTTPPDTRSPVPPPIVTALSTRAREELLPSPERSPDLHSEPCAAEVPLPVSDEEADLSGPMHPGSLTMSSSRATPTRNTNTAAGASTLATVTPSASLDEDVNKIMAVDTPPAILSRYEMLLQQKGMHKVGGSPMRSPTRSPTRTRAMEPRSKSPKLTPAKERRTVSSSTSPRRTPLMTPREGWKEFVDNIDCLADADAAISAADVEVEIDCASAPASAPASAAKRPSTPSPPPEENLSPKQLHSPTRNNNTDRSKSRASPLREKQDLINSALKKLSSQRADVSIHDIVAKQGSALTCSSASKQ